MYLILGVILYFFAPPPASGQRRVPAARGAVGTDAQRARAALPPRGAAEIGGTGDQEVAKGDHTHLIKCT